MQEISVSSLVSYLKNKLDTDNNLQRISVIGEISNYHRHYSGHLYFSLKDERAQISCVMFKSSAASLNFEPKTGDKVVCVANTSLFEASGQLQLYVLKMNQYGLGDLYAQYEKLKADLLKEGYFDQEHKKVLLNKYPERFAVLVGDKSAAMSDIKIQFKRRWPLCKVDYYPVLVQGKEAPDSIIEKLKEVDNLNYDGIILARGGGSFEDLFCFNDEKLVKTIYNLKTFIVTGVGHEQDFTLVDFVSDLRAPTPTGAVELITPNILDVYDEIDSYIDSLNSLISDKVYTANNLFDFKLEKLIHFNLKLDNIDNRIDQLLDKLRIYLNNKKSIYLNNISHSVTNMNKEINYKLNNYVLALKRLNTLLEAYSSNNVLKRGYSLVLQDDKVIKSANDLSDKEFEIKFYNSKIKAIRKDN